MGRPKNATAKKKVKFSCSHSRYFTYPPSQGELVWCSDCEKEVVCISKDPIIALETLRQQQRLAQSLFRETLDADPGP